VASGVEIAAHGCKDLPEHFGGEHAGVRVVSRTMVAAEQRNWAELVPPAVYKRKRGQSAAERTHCAFVRDAAESNDCAQPFHLADRRRQKVTAGFYLFRRRLVLGRYAAHRICDAAIDKLEPVIGMRMILPAGKSIFSSVS